MAKAKEYGRQTNKKYILLDEDSYRDIQIIEKDGTLQGLVHDGSCTAYWEKKKFRIEKTAQA